MLTFDFMNHGYNFSDVRSVMLYMRVRVCVRVSVGVSVCECVRVCVC